MQTASRYQRTTDLPRLMAVWPKELGEDLPTRARLLDIMKRALREERRLGLAGHFSYSLPRHRALYAAYREEVTTAAALAAEVIAVVGSEKLDWRVTIERHHAALIPPKDLAARVLEAHAT
jgi:hypothetical protein